MKKQRAGKKRKRTKARGLYYLIFALVVVIVGSLLGWFLFFRGEVSFEEAMRKPELRDGYIEKIVKKVGEKPEYIYAVYYVDTQAEMEFLKKEYEVPVNPKATMASVGKMKTVDNRVAVFPYAFGGELIKTEEDFISNLLHEYRHVEVAYKGRIGSIEIYSSFLTTEGKLNESLLEDIVELDASAMELTRQTNISQTYRSNLLVGYMEYYSDIWNHEKIMKPEFIKFLKIEFFRPWVLGSRDLVKERQGGKEVWYLKHPQTGKRYYLPEEVIRKFQNGKG